MVRVWFFLFLVGSTAWGSKWNIFGPDDRLPLGPTQWPASALGKVSGRVQCTGTLVGERIVLTAAHCLRFVGTQLDLRRPPTFAVSVQQGRSAAVNLPVGIAVTAGSWRRDEDGRSEDWAVLALSEAPRHSDGSPFTWLDVKNLSLAGGDVVSTAGYSVDIQGGGSPSLHQACHIRESFPEGFFFHDCDVYAGASGGPILRDFVDPRLGRLTPFVVGITNAHFSDGTPGLTLPDFSVEHANVGANAASFYRAVLDMRRAFPGRSP